MIEALQAWWSVVLLVVFLAIIGWVFWPRHKKWLENHGTTPLREGERREER